MSPPDSGAEATHFSLFSFPDRRRLASARLLSIVYLLGH